MGYAVYEYDHRWQGYGVPAICDEPGCAESIDRGLGYMCGEEPGAERGCGLFFCSQHLYLGPWDDDPDMCCRCASGEPPCEPKPDTAEWIDHVLTDSSWATWRAENPERVNAMCGDEEWWT